MENTSLRGRFSLSTTNLTSPVAESTCLNGSSSRAKFNWGEGTIGTRNRNNSLTTNKNISISKNLNGTPPKVSMSPISRIDPRTYVDIHSNGLASRIVKYHDNSARLNRSLSMGNLYNKPGQFPVVHLKKNEQQYKAKKSRNLSMTRIAAPEKSVFHGNTLSGILRSGSIVGLQKTDEEISRENRPILHPPPTENEMAPTRSVLEVLKEISRKRINSDELDGTELIKKHCKEPEFDTIPYNGQKTQSKRQREMSTSTTSNVQLSPEQQMVKKRMCNFNNDIMSSLSSSMLSANKKRLLEIQSQKQTACESVASNTSSASLTNTQSSRSEKQRCLASFELENLAQPIKYTPITPLPSTPQQSTGNELDNNKNVLVARRASEPVISTKPKITLFNKDYDEVPTRTRSDPTEYTGDGDLCGIQFVKPKKSSSLSSSGSLLMERTKKSKLALMLSGLKGELNEEDEVDALSKVEQKKEVEVSVNVSIATTSAPSVPSTQASMSFGTITTTATTLIPTPDTTSKSVAEGAATTSTIVKSGLQFNPPTTKDSVSTTTSNGFQVSTTTAVVSTSSTPAVVSLPAITTSSPILAVTSTANTIPTLGGFSFGLNKPLSLPSTTTAAVTAQPAVVQVTTAMSTSAGTPPTTVAVMKPPFAFGLSTSQASTSTAPSFAFGVPSTSAQSVAATQAPLIASAFGSAPTATTKSADAPLPSFGQVSATAQPAFLFGSLAASNSKSTTNSLTPATSTPATATAPTFNSWNPSAGQASANANPILSLSSFGGVATSTSVPQSTSTLSSTTSTGGFLFSGSFSRNAFTFGSTTAPSATVTNPSQAPMFGTITPVKANTFFLGTPAPAAPVKSSFSFPSTDKSSVPTTTAGNSDGGFPFNPPATNSLPVPDPNKNIFGSAAPAAPASAKPVFNFGSAPTSQTTSKPPIFGDSTVKPTNLFGAPTAATIQNSPFVFGSSSGTSTNQGTTATAPSTNLFGAAPTSNQTSGLNTSTSTSGSIFGAPSATVAPLQQSSTFTFGASSNNTTAESNKPAASFVFGSSSSIGSNASKPAADMNKTFLFGDGSTTITPAPPGTTNLFGGGNATNSGPTGPTENKMFSFGGAGAGTAGNNNTFGGNRQTVNQSPVFNFGSTAPATPVPAQNGNLFAQQPTGAPPTMMGTSDRPIRKAMRRLHKT